MKKYSLLILLIIVILIVPCGCKKNSQEKVKDDNQITDIEDNIVNNEENIETEEPVDNTDSTIEEEKKEDNKTETVKEDNKKDENKVENKEEPKKETSKNDSNENNKNSSTATDNKKDNTTSQSNTSNNTIDNKKEETTSQSNTSNNTTDNKKEDTTSQSNNSSNTNTNTETKPVETDEVDNLRNNIQNTYGVTIKYGDEIGSYRPKGLTPVKMTDKNEIKTYLNYTKTELAKYPNGFFREMKDFGMPLTIYLVTSVPNNSFAGFTDREFMKDIKITVVKGYDFSYTLNHEIMHYIDAYLECKMYPNSPYDEYTALNPTGYNYGSEIDRYNFGYNGENKEVYFMDNYAQTNVREDRAQVFRQMISRTYKLSGMFDEGTVLQKKALVIDKQIRQYYDCAKGTSTWDKFIK